MTTFVKTRSNRPPVRPALRPAPAALALVLAATVVLAQSAPPLAAPPAGGGTPSKDGLTTGEPHIPTAVQEVAKVPVIVVEPTRPLVPASRDTRLRSGLADLLQSVKGPARIVLGSGHHDLGPMEHAETCRHCEDPARPVVASYGLRVRGQRIVIEGAAPESVFIHSGAGYGILFDDCQECALRGVTVTGGARDEDPRATDAAIVVKGGSLALQRCHARDNVGDAAAVARAGTGVGGVVARDGAQLTMSECRIERCSWDGIALWNVTAAEVRNNVVDGVDGGGEAGGGGGVGIRIVGDADATIEGNLVARYAHGIGLFGGVRAKVRQNIVEDIGAWGLVAASGPAEMPGGQRAVEPRRDPSIELRRNAVYASGACGAAIAGAGDAAAGAPPDAGAARTGARGERGRSRGSLLFAGNAFAQTATSGAAPTPVADAASPAPLVCLETADPKTEWPKGIEVRDNVMLGAAGAGDAKGLVGRFEKWTALRGSRFLRDFKGR